MTTGLENGHANLEGLETPEELAEALGLDEEDLQPLSYQDHDLSVSGSNSSDADKQYAYSTILANALRLGIADLVSFVRDYVPDDRQGKVLLSGLLDLGDREFASPACQRRLRFEQAEQQSKFWADHLEKEYVEAKATADTLISRWSQANLVLTAIRLRRLRSDVLTVQREKARWYTALKKQEMTELDACKLPAMAYEYYRAKLQVFSIQREEAEDLAKDIPTHDHSGLIKRLRAGESKDGEVATQAPWAMLKAIRFALQNAGMKNAFWDQSRRMVNGDSGTGNIMQRRRPNRHRQADASQAAPHNNLGGLT